MKVNIMKKITTILMLVAVGSAWVAPDCSAKPVEREKGKNGAQKRQGKADGQQRGADRDPAKRVQKILEQFDTNGDQKLDAAELQEFLASASQRRGQGKQRGGNRADKGEGQSPDMEGAKRGKREGRKGKGKGKKKAEEGTDFQGATPNLPPAE